MKKNLIIALGLAGAVIALLLVWAAVKKGPCRLGGGSGPARTLSQEAQRLEETGELSAARQAYGKLIAEHPNLRDAAEWQKKVEQLNIRLLFSPALTDKSEEYQIKPGDSLDKIAREHHTTVELLKRSNDLADDRIVPGRKIKVWKGKFTILVDKSQNTLLLKSDEDLMKSYTVSTGSGNSTPVGTFKIIEKIVNPPWYRDGKVIPPSSPENILGTRWMGWDKKGYGIHGTRDPENLGKQVTAGCVRMSNSDVEELFAIVPTGTEVTVVD